MVKINYTYQTYILFLLWVSGMVKPFFTAYIANIDIVLLALFLACMDILFQIVTKLRIPTKEYLYAFLMIICLYAYILLSLVYSPSDSYSKEKAINFIPNVVFFVYAFALKKINIRLLIKCYCFVLIPLAFYFIYMKSIVWQVDNDATRIFKDLRNYYLSIGFQLGLLLFLCYYSFRKIWLLAVLFFLLLASSARGALITTVLTFLIFEFKIVRHIKLKKRMLRMGMITMAFGVIVSFLFRAKLMLLLQNSLVRFSVLFSGQGKSSLERINAMSFALKNSFDSLFHFLFGHGIGSFGVLYLGVDGRAYPHNLFLEILFELGVTALIVVIVLFMSTFLSALKGNKMLLALLFFCFLNAMKSSNLTDLWILFSILGLILNQKKYFLLNK